MNENLTDTTLELTIRLTNAEANLLREAIAKSATEAESKRASTLLFGSLRSRKARYLIRKLGMDAAI